ncbi:hypothetical protein Tco_0059911 [Tanacetum coccineum]
MDYDTTPDKQVQSSGDEDIGHDHIPMVNLRQNWWKPLTEDRPATPEPAWPALSISKIKAAYYPDVGLEQMVPDQMWIEKECKHTSEGDRRAVRTHMQILSVVRIEVFSLYGYDYMKKIVFYRADLKEYTIAEWDFKYLYPSDFEDLDKYGVQMIMRLNEIHKFSGDTLQLIDEALDYQVKEFKVNRMNPDKVNLLKPRKLYWWKDKRGRLQTAEENRMITSSRQSKSISCGSYKVGKVRYSIQGSRQSRRDLPRDNSLVSVEVLRSVLTDPKVHLKMEMEIPRSSRVNSQSFTQL